MSGISTRLGASTSDTTPAGRTCYEVEEVRRLRVPVPGGATLVGDLYRPVTAWPVPAVLTLHRGRRVMGVRCFREFAAHGYATLVVDTRGVGGSTGRSRPVLDPAEAEDGAAVVQWLAGQPWCTGAVGMWGLSYGAALTLAVAVRRPPALRAIVPVMGFVDPGPDLIHPAGIRGGMGYASFSCIEAMLNDLLPPLRGPELVARRDCWRRRLDELEPWPLDAWRHRPGDPAWSDRRLDVTAITAATFVVAGWRDLFCGSMLAAYAALQAPKRLIVGPWLHELPEKSPVQPVDSLELACQWWARWLDDRPAERHTETVTVFVQGAGRWGETPGWPPATPPAPTLVARADGMLAPPVSTAHAGPAAEPVAGGDDPTVGPLSGLCGLPVSDIGYPLDQHDDDMRSISFTGAPLAGPLLLAGSPVVTLQFDPAGTTASRCVVKLADVARDGRSTLVTSGTTPLSGPGPVTLRLDPTCYQLDRAHRLRLVLSTGDFPRLWPAEPEERLAVRVAPGPAVTSVQLPVTAPGVFAPAAPPQPAAPPPSGPAKFAQLPVWRISREQVAQTVRLDIAATEHRLFSPDQHVIRERDFSTSASVAATDPAGARLTAAAAFAIDAEHDGPVGVRVELELGRNRSTAAGEVRIDGVPIFRREWSSDAGAAG